MSWMHSKKTILEGGFKVLSRFLKEEKSRFSGGPILILESFPGGDEPQNVSKKYSKHPNEPTRRIPHHNNNQDDNVTKSLVGRQIQFLLGQQMGLRTMVISNDRRFNNPSNVEELLDLVVRLGATTVCGIGDRATLDLAKAVVVIPPHVENNDSSSSSSWPSQRKKKKKHVVDELLLIPNTYDAVLSCAYSPYSLLLHSQENVLIPHPSSPILTHNDDDHVHLADEFEKDDPQLQWNSTMPMTTIACLDVDVFGTPEINNNNNNNNNQDNKDIRLLERQQIIAIAACLSLLLDYCLYSHDDWSGDPTQGDLVEPLIRQCQLLLDPQNKTYNNNNNYHPQKHGEILHLLLQTGSQFLNFGLDPHSRRSTPFGMAVSLLPTIFPNRDLLDIMAATLPALWRQQQQQEENGSASFHHHPSLPHWLPSQLFPDIPSLAILAQDDNNDSLDDTRMDAIVDNQFHWNCVDAASNSEIQQFLLPQQQQQQGNGPETGKRPHHTHNG